MKTKKFHAHVRFHIERSSIFTSTKKWSYKESNSGKNGACATNNISLITCNPVQLHIVFFKSDLEVHLNFSIFTDLFRF